MKIQVFRVQPRGETTLDNTLGHLANIPLEQRLRRVGNIEVRLEASHHQGNVWLLDFGGIRQDGPGRASANAPIEDFDLADTEGFGHETAAYFDTETNYLTIQYNHFGPRIGKIQAYLFRFSRLAAGRAEMEELPDGQDGFNFIPVMRPGAAERLNDLNLVKTFEIAVHVPGLLANENGQRQSLSSLLDSPLVGSAEQLRLRLSAGRSRQSSLSLGAVREWASELLGVREDVIELSISGRENEEAPNEPLDLLRARLEADIPVHRNGRRYGREERWAALRQAYQTWRDNGQLG